MQTVILDDIRPQISQGDLLKRLRVAKGSPLATELLDLLGQAESIARPKALCGLTYIDDRGEDFVVVDGIRFSSRVLAVNLQGTQRVFPYLATCGTEIEAWANNLDDMLHRFWSEAIREMVMRNAMKQVDVYLQDSFGQGETARMSPGSLTDWPIEQQSSLFQLLGETESTIGVRLTDSLLMVPTKTVSGIRFGAENGFESCMLCPRPSCPNRRAPHDPALYDSRYRAQPK